jgi:hypothetical protein
VTAGHVDTFERSPKNRVREPSIVASPPPVLADVPFWPAHPLNRLIAQLNKNWRVVDDPLQWVLQRRKGNPRKKNSGWRDRSFCRTREGLSRCVRDYCGEIDAAAFAKINTLPDHYEDWRAIQNLDVRGPYQAPEGSRTDSLLSQELEAPEVETDVAQSAPSPTCLVMRSAAQSDATS